jgi:hypothetical protein
MLCYLPSLSIRERRRRKEKKYEECDECVDSLLKEGRKNGNICMYVYSGREIREFSDIVDAGWRSTY